MAAPQDDSDSASTVAGCDGQPSAPPLFSRLKVWAWRKLAPHFDQTLFGSLQDTGGLHRALFAIILRARSSDGYLRCVCPRLPCRALCPACPPFHAAFSLATCHPAGAFSAGQLAAVAAGALVSQSTALVAASFLVNALAQKSLLSLLPLLTFFCVIGVQYVPACSEQCAWLLYSSPHVPCVSLRYCITVTLRWCTDRLCVCVRVCVCFRVAGTPNPHGACGTCA